MHVRTATHEAQRAMSVTPELVESPMDSYIHARLEPFLGRLLGDENPLDVLRAVYAAGAHDGLIRLGEFIAANEPA